MLACLIGAGFSKWAMNVPTVAQLFDFNVSLTSERDRRRLTLVREAKTRWDRAHPGMNNEQFVAYALESGPRLRSQVLWYITRRLSEPFMATMLGGMQSFMIDDSRRFRLEGMALGRSFFDSVQRVPFSGVITPNYDLMVEYALGSSGFNYGRMGEELFGRGKNPWFPWQGLPVTLTGQVRVAKIHGSLSWDRERKYTDGRAGVRGTAVIIPPSPEKTPPTALEDVWHLAREILRSATRILVFGFAFNPQDEAVLALLEVAGRRCERALLVDPAPPVRQAQLVWKDAEILTAPPSRSVQEIERWVSLLMQ